MNGLMIVRMSKVSVAGPRSRIKEVIDYLEGKGTFHAEISSAGYVTGREREGIESFRPDERMIREREFLESLRLKIDELFSYLPRTPVRESYLDPCRAVREVAGVLERHLASCRDLAARKDKLNREMLEIARYKPFLDALGGLLHGVREAPDVAFFGLTIKTPETLPRVRELLGALTGDRFELLTARLPDGSEAALLVVGRSVAGKVRDALYAERIPELEFPASLHELPLTDKVALVKEREALLVSEIEVVEGELARFAARWGPVYHQVRRWLDEQLSVLRATSFAQQTRSCFFLYGWVPARDVPALRAELDERFGGTVVVEEKAILEEELEKVPILIRNPPYFKPFELFTRLLPLPKYTSFDPTPFLGIFFPLFFGMILGDAGYGLVLGGLSLWLARRFPRGGNLRDAGRVLLVSSCYTVVFGLLYGEFFGDLGNRLFGMEPICLERRKSVLPLLYFAVSVGFFHVVLGILLGLIKAVKRGAMKESASRALSLLIIAGLTVFIASLTGLLPALLTRPMAVAMAVLVVLLVIVGGSLAFLELLKSVGNIISYARIMAVGLASVLLAFVANRVAGLAGDIVVGVLAGFVLHAINILIGLLSPTIHSVRLHYVEFFGKFIEPGGRRYEPLKKP
jgi:V/A-type H+-transporting ATPase subunit I